MYDQNFPVDYIVSAFSEDIGDGDHSTLCCIDPSARGKAVLKIKENGIIAGIDVARSVFQLADPDVVFNQHKNDGEIVAFGDTAFDVEASVHTILKCERLVLNIMQRMTGIATLTRQYTNKLTSYHTRLLDTRKTTPNFRWFEKKAVLIGGGLNHRMGLYDMIMLKDNHIDYCGSIEKAVEMAVHYANQVKPGLKIEVETRSLEEVIKLVGTGSSIHRIMLDNFTPEMLSDAVRYIDGRYETEASGGITLDTIETYAATGVDFVSCGAVIHHAVSADLSLKAFLM